jgi:Sad1 / UNC-like C-terminal
MNAPFVQPTAAMRAHRLCFAGRECFSFVSVGWIWLALRDITVGPSSYLLVSAQAAAEANTHGNDLVRLLNQASIKAQSALQRHEEQLAVSKTILQSFNSELVSSSMARSSDSFQLSEQIAAAERQRDALIAQANAQQLQELSEELQQRFSAAIAAVDHPPSPNVNNGTVSRDDSNETIDLGQLLNARDILNHSENLLTRWIVQHIEQQVDQELQAWDDTTLQSLDFESLAADEAASPLCITPVQAATEVHAALIRHSDTGDDDSNGPWHNFAASIVPSLTSPTYLGNGSSDWESWWQWWTRQVPQDWYDGWKSAVPQEWSDHVYAWLQTTVSSVLQPQWEYAWHSLGWAATTAPPHAILQASNFPGHCWPVAMTGQSTRSKHHQNSPRVSIPGPHVTIRLQPFLARTAAVTVVVDHVSRMLLWEPEAQLQSAPKRFNVYGYGPCPDDRRCRGLGFDPATATLLTESSLLYDIDADSNIQTFVIAPSNRTTSQPSPAPVPAPLDESHDGSCSAVLPEPSCGAPLSTTNSSASPIAAITVEIVENWGNKEYTCLYGLRVHGEPSQ